ncbi:MAG: glutaredoxin family protein [Patescibacteria group bacterium]
MNIIVYTKTGCPWGEEVVGLLRERGVSFEERDMFKNPAYKEEALEKSGQWKSPTVDIDGHILSDSDAMEVGAYLESILKETKVENQELSGEFKKLIK